MSIQNWKVIYCDCEKYPYLCEIYERLDNKPSDMTENKLLEMMGWKSGDGGKHICKSCYDEGLTKAK